MNPLLQLQQYIFQLPHTLSLFRADSREFYLNPEWVKEEGPEVTIVNQQLEAITGTHRGPNSRFTVDV
jgi:hypothetical protein